MPYAVVAIETWGSWPTVDTTVEFSGWALTMRPGSKTRYPTVVLKYEPDSQNAFAEAISLVRRFLSSLAWVDERPIRDVMTGGGGFPVFLGRPDIRESSVITPGEWRCEYLPEPTDPAARRALALYREALGLEDVSKPYAFLGYAKILNILISDWKEQVKWMNDTIPQIRDHFALQRLTELRKTEPDLGLYLYASGRCAVAHANADPTVDPDDAGDTLRLAQDLPLAKTLAEHFIETQLGVKTLSTIYREHLYELAGFRPLFGEEIVSKGKSGEIPDAEAVWTVRLPRLTIRLDHGGREKDEIAFANLLVKPLAVGSGVIVLGCDSGDNRLRLTLVLDLGNERLGFDPEREVQINDDGSANCVDYAITRVRFIRGMVLNGRTETINADTGERLGRTDACVPVNIDLSATMEKLDTVLAELESERARRTAERKAQAEPPSGEA